MLGGAMVLAEGRHPKGGDPLLGAPSRSDSTVPKAGPEFEGRSVVSSPRGLVLQSTSGVLEPVECLKSSMRFGRMRKGVMATGDVMQGDLGPKRWACVMVTLTYRPGADWAPRQVSEFLKFVREYCGRRGFKVPGVWVVELQQRGAPHYHVLLWLPPGVRLPKPDERGWWRHGSSRIEWARRPVAYLAKYASKGLDPADDLPKGARLWGGFGRDREQLRMVRWRCAPRWLLDFAEHIGELGCGALRRLSSGWWQVGGGEVRSPWRLVGWNAVSVTLVNVGAVEWRPSVG